MAVTLLRLPLAAGFGPGVSFQMVPDQCRIAGSGPGMLRPTAQAVAGDQAATPVRPLAGATLGLGTCVHLTPFQRRIRSLTPGRSASPTAQAYWADKAATPWRKFWRAGFGLGTRVHLVPFQCKIKVFWLPLSPQPVKPTAQAFWAERAATPGRVIERATVGLDICFQVVPFQCRMSDLPGVEE